MALKAGRVGVAKDQVDEFGKIKGGSTPENVYTKTQCDNKFETKTHANNIYQQKNIEVPLELLGGSQLTVEASLHAIEDTFGNLQFRDNEGTPQVKTHDGDWVNFNSGGGDIGFNIPDELIQTTGITFSNMSRVDGGYYHDVVNKILYLDVTVLLSSDSGNFYIAGISQKLVEGSKSLCMEKVSGDVNYVGTAIVGSWSDAGVVVSGRSTNTYRITGTIACN